MVSIIFLSSPSLLSLVSIPFLSFFETRSSFKTFFIPFILCLSLCLCVCVHANTCHGVPVETREHLVAYFHHVGSGIKLRSSVLAEGPREDTLPVLRQDSVILSMTVLNSLTQMMLLRQPLERELQAHVQYPNFSCPLL